MSDIRKIRKPLMEKKRRARINDSLEILKTIVLRNTYTVENGKVPAKLEKADILEMTVRHLKVLYGERIPVSEVTSTTPEIDYTASKSNVLRKIDFNSNYGCDCEPKATSVLDCSASEADKENVVPPGFLKQSVQKRVDTGFKNHWRPWT